MTAEISPAPRAGTGSVLGPQNESAAAPVPPKAKVALAQPVALRFDEAQNRQNVKTAISELNHQMASTKTGLGFSMDNILNRPVVTVRNTQTGEVVRQIPNEVVLKVAHSIDQLKGLLLNARV